MMNIYAKPGDKVRFENPDYGHKSDSENAAKHLRVGEVYTVESTMVGDFETRVVLKEATGTHPMGKRIDFNSVQFEDVESAR